MGQNDLPANTVKFHRFERDVLQTFFQPLPSWQTGTSVHCGLCTKYTFIYTEPSLEEVEYFIRLCFVEPLVPLFWISVDVFSGFQRQSGFCFIRFFVEVNVIYIPQDPLLALQYHSQSLGLDLNGQSPGQKTNALLLCQRPRYREKTITCISSVLIWFI